jgi:CRP/FNR family transcriptional regulator, cyclic AMP receptor protein
VDDKPISRYAELLRSGKWFRNLPDDLQQRLMQLARQRTLEAGEQLFSRGDPPCGMYAVVVGCIRVVGLTEDGKEILLALLEPPSWIGEIGVIDGDVRTHDVVAQTASTLLQVPQQELESLLAARPQYWRDVAMLLTGRLRMSFSVLEDGVSLPLEMRLARRLLLTIDAHGELHDQTFRVVNLRQEQLATMLGTSRQTLNTVLRDYVSQGLIRVSYGQIEVIDVDGLRRAAAWDEHR